MLPIAGRKVVGEEEHVELAALGRRGDVLHQREVGPPGMASGCRQPAT
jgi:hypothetical protein